MTEVTDNIDCGLLAKGDFLWFKVWVHAVSCASFKLRMPCRFLTASRETNADKALSWTLREISQYEQFFRLQSIRYRTPCKVDCGLLLRFFLLPARYNNRQHAVILFVVYSSCCVFNPVFRTQGFVQNMRGKARCILRILRVWGEAVECSVLRVRLLPVRGCSALWLVSWKPTTGHDAHKR